MIYCKMHKLHVNSRGGSKLEPPVPPLYITPKITLAPPFPVPFIGAPVSECSGSAHVYEKLICKCKSHRICELHACFNSDSMMAHISI